MASLTEISIGARKAIRYGVYLLIFGLIARTLFNVGHSIYLRIFPPAPEKPTVAFGSLSKIPFPERKFPQNPKFPDSLEYKVETPDGKFPAFPLQVPVYKMPPIPQNINALETAKSNAQSLGFNPNGKPILESTPNVWIFQKTGSPSSMTMNIITGVFSISYDIGQDPSILTGTPLAEEAAANQVKSYLLSAELLQKDIEDGRVAHEFLKAENRNIVSADSLSEANLIKINLFRKNYGAKGEIISVTPDMPEANVWFIIGANARNIVSAEYHYYPVKEDEKGTYPIKTGEEAFNDLKDKKGFIVNIGDNQSGSITLRKIYLAYYDAGQYQEYYQPVVVFEGDNNFLAYVPAVKADFYGTENK